MLRIATSPIEGRPWHSAKLRLFARGSPTRGAGAQRLRGCTKDSLTVSRSGENLSVIACAMPPPLSRGGFGIPQGFISSPEAPLLGELASDSETERLYEGQHDREPQRGKPLRQCFALPPPLSRGGLGIPQSFVSSPEAPLGRGAVRRSLTERFSPHHRSQPP